MIPSPEKPLMTETWDQHYTRPRAEQAYPDENLVRLLSALPPGPFFDLGTGSGRHLKLAAELGFSPIVGADVSATAVALCRKKYPFARVMVLEEPEPGTETHLPFPDEYFQVVTAWGVLHYNAPEGAQNLVSEACRILRRGGHFLGTLRAAADTHLAGNPDVPGLDVQYFTEAEARDLLSSRFPNVQLGYAERSPVGELDRRICHWIFRAVK